MNGKRLFDLSYLIISIGTIVAYTSHLFFSLSISDSARAIWRIGESGTYELTLIKEMVLETNGFTIGDLGLTILLIGILLMIYFVICYFWGRTNGEN